MSAYFLNKQLGILYLKSIKSCFQLTIKWNKNGWKTRELQTVPSVNLQSMFVPKYFM